jgi:Tfp pilus assembly protein PilF
MSSTAETLDRAYQALRAGSFPQAEQLCRQVLQADPANALAWFWLGAACQCQHKLSEAATHYRQALALRPDFAEAHSNYGAVLATQGRLEDAVTHFRQALQINPRFADA